MAEAMGDDLSGSAPGAPFHIAAFPDTQTTAYGWPIKPEYMAVALAEMAERYPDLPPVYITEGGASFEDLVIKDAASGRLIIPDERRALYLSDHIRTAIDATSPGGAAESIDLRGYYVWSLWTTSSGPGATSSSSACCMWTTAPSSARPRPPTTGSRSCSRPGTPELRPRGCRGAGRPSPAGG